MIICFIANICIHFNIILFLGGVICLLWVVIFGDLIHLFGDLIPFLDTLIDEVDVVVETILFEFGDLTLYSIASEFLANDVSSSNVVSLII